MESSRRKIISTEHGGRYGSSSSISPKRKSPSKNSNFSGEGASAGFTSSVRVDKPSAHKVIPSIHPHEVTALKRSFEISSNCSSLGGMQSSSSHTRLLPRESTSPLILRRKVPFLPVPPANDGHIYIPFENLPAHASSIVHIFGVGLDL